MGFGKNNTGAILRLNASIALSTLGSGAAIKLSGLIALTEDFRLLKSEILADISGLTGGEADQLVLGMCNNELSNAEIAECIVAGGPVDRNDRLAQERAERWVKLLGKMVLTDSSGTQGYFRSETGGPLIIVKPRWTFSDPEGWAYFIFNNGAAALTTGATARVLATNYGLWMT